MKRQGSGKSGKKQKKQENGLKRKRGVNVSEISDDKGNPNKITIRSPKTSHGEDLQNSMSEQSQKSQGQVQGVCYSTPADQTNNATGNVQQNQNQSFQYPTSLINYSLSPIGFPPQNPAMVQPVGSIQQFDYATKMDSIEQKLNQMCLMCEKLKKLDTIETKINSFEKNMSSITEEVTGLKRQVNDIEDSVKFTSAKIDEYEKNSKEIKTQLKNIEPADREQKSPT
jgi:hypothetical protein